MEAILSEWLRSARGHDFVLVIAGRISGVHDAKGTHRPLDYKIDHGNVSIQFHGAEYLEISDPRGVVLHPNGELTVRDASGARYLCYSQEDPHVSHTICEEVYRKFGKFFVFNRIGAPFTTSAFLPCGGDEFIVLRYG